MPRVLVAAVRAVVFVGFATAIVHAETLRSVQVVDSKGVSVESAVVEIEAQPTVAPTAQADFVMDQIDFQFSPRVLPVPQGAEVRFPNSDKSRHHVYSFSEAKTFEIKLYGGDEAPPITFEQAGIVALGCNIHDGMSGHIYVSSSGLYGITNEDGKADIPNYQAGTENRLQVWHADMPEPLYLMMADLTIDASGNTIIRLPIEVKNEEVKTTGSSLRDRLQGFKSNGN